MTIKTRNRLNYFLFIISLLVLAMNLAVFIFRIIKYPIFENYYYLDAPERNNIVASFLFDYSPLFVYVSLFVMNIYVCVVFYIIIRAFEKTQNTEICFFGCFLIACLAETSRLYIPVFDVGETSSLLLIVLGNFSAFARILAPLSFLFAAIMSRPEERQNLERNLALILVSSLFFAAIIPLNTSVIEPSFRVHIGFDRIVVMIEILTDFCAVIALIIYNTRNRSGQRTTVGLVLVITGFVFNVNGTNFIKALLGFVCLGLGSYFYLNALHNQHLYD